MTHRLRDREEGQIIPALLLFVVVLVFFGLAFAQVGSAAEKKTQTQTAADAAAVATAHRLRDSTLGTVAALIPTQLHWAQQFNGVFVPPPAFTTTSCAAAQRNWDSNPHRNNARLDCTLMSVASDFRAVHVELKAPRDQVVPGPVEGAEDGTEVADLQARATATARVSMSRCPRGLVGIQKTVADFLADQTLIALHAITGRACLTPDEAAQLVALESNPVAAAAAATQLGPPQPIINSVRNGLYAELVD